MEETKLALDVVVNALDFLLQAVRDDWDRAPSGSDLEATLADFEKAVIDLDGKVTDLVMAAEDEP